ncbi:MAG TPA: DUF5908 family protein [Ignavibacteria bacterium]|nr:DUF5908 family protein [Ignavibacteria bacterium]HMR39477.1 DUF5908 family protein [Ignavibacteria bacterium]
MPIEIKELHIKATIDNGNGGSRDNSRDKELKKMKAEIVKECVEEVFEILKEKEER